MALCADISMLFSRYQWIAEVGRKCLGGSGSLLLRRVVGIFPY